MPDRETWKFLNTFAGWVSAAATFTAVVTSLYLARRSDRVVLVPVASADQAPKRACILLVNKHSDEVLFTTLAFLVESCIDTYEAVLKAEGEGWCLTLGFPSHRMRDSVRGKVLRRQLEKVGLCDITPSRKEQRDKQQRGTTIL
jgi:hypothetical protein